MGHASSLQLDEEPLRVVSGGAVPEEVRRHQREQLLQQQERAARQPPPVPYLTAAAVTAGPLVSPKGVSPRKSEEGSASVLCSAALTSPSNASTVSPPGMPSHSHVAPPLGRWVTASGTTAAATAGRSPSPEAHNRSGSTTASWSRGAPDSILLPSRVTSAGTQRGGPSVLTSLPPSPANGSGTGRGSREESPTAGSASLGHENVVTPRAGREYTGHTPTLPGSLTAVPQSVNMDGSNTPTPRQPMASSRTAEAAFRQAIAAHDAGPQAAQSTREPRRSPPPAGASSPSPLSAERVAVPGSGAPPAPSTREDSWGSGDDDFDADFDDDDEDLNDSSAQFMLAAMGQWKIPHSYLSSSDTGKRIGRGFNLRSVEAGSGTDRSRLTQSLDRLPGDVLSPYAPLGQRQQPRGTANPSELPSLHFRGSFSASVGSAAAGVRASTPPAPRHNAFLPKPSSTTGTRDSLSTHYGSHGLTSTQSLLPTDHGTPRAREPFSKETGSTPSAPSSAVASEIDVTAGRRLAPLHRLPNGATTAGPLMGGAGVTPLEASPLHEARVQSVGGEEHLNSTSASMQEGASGGSRRSSSVIVFDRNVLLLDDSQTRVVQMPDSDTGRHRAALAQRSPSSGMRGGVGNASRLAPLQSRPGDPVFLSRKLALSPVLSLRSSFDEPMTVSEQAAREEAALIAAQRQLQQQQRQQQQHAHSGPRTPTPSRPRFSYDRTLYRPVNPAVSSSASPRPVPATSTSVEGQSSSHTQTSTLRSATNLAGSADTVLRAGSTSPPANRSGPTHMHSPLPSCALAQDSVSASSGSAETVGARLTGEKVKAQPAKPLTAAQRSKRLLQTVSGSGSDSLVTI